MGVRGVQERFREKPLYILALVKNPAGHELVNQHGQAGYEASLDGYELVNQLVLVAVTT